MISNEANHGLRDLFIRDAYSLGFRRGVFVGVFFSVAVTGTVIACILL